MPYWIKGENYIIANFDHDLYPEILVVSWDARGWVSRITTLNGETGNPLWEKDFKGVSFSPVLYPFVNARDKYVIILNVTGISKPSQISIINGKNGRILRTIALDKLDVRSIAVGDINNDTLNEIVFCTFYSGLVGVITLQNDIIWELSLNESIITDPALGDLDGDGYTDIVVGGENATIFVINGFDGKLSWSIKLNESIYSSPILHDMNYDGYLDIIVIGSEYVYLIDGIKKRPTWRYPVKGYTRAAPALGDLNGDGALDIIISNGYGNTTFAINGANGELLWEYRTGGIPVLVSAVVGDLNGDKYLDVVISGYNGTIFCLNGKNGHLLWKYVVKSNILTPPILCDLDRNGDVEIIICDIAGYVYALDVLQRNAVRIYWQFPFGDSHRRRNTQYVDEDRDCLSTYSEYLFFTDPSDPDTDDDNIIDFWEVLMNLNPNDPYDAYLDYDHDGIINVKEYSLLTNPWKQDTDDDGMPDNWEIRYNLDPTNSLDANSDLDEDGLSNLDEYKFNTNPLDPDTDNDGYSDGYEVLLGTNPNDKKSHPIRKKHPVKNLIRIFLVISIFLICILLMILFVSRGFKIHTKLGIIESKKKSE